jgi:methyl-accepting chemotaxis protein I, serine sensor receptor
MMADISASSLEQSTAIEQVNHAVVQMDEMTQQTHQLKDTVTVFEISDWVLAGSR